METSISKFPDFIGVFENAVPNQICDELILKFEELNAAGYSISRQQEDGVSKLHKHDDVVFGTENISVIGRVQPDALNLIWTNAYNDYASVFSVLNQMQKHVITEMKIQRTVVGGGYHAWHCETDSLQTSRRLFAYTIYLNDVEEGGETEFLYYHKRIKPKKGTIVLFPAGFTHTHRGNPPLSNTKYIATGWIEF